MLSLPHALHCVFLYLTSTDTVWHTVLVSVCPLPLHTHTHTHKYFFSNLDSPLSKFTRELKIRVGGKKGNRTEPNRTTGLYRTEPTEISDTCGTGFYRRHRTELFGVTIFLNLITHISRYTYLSIIYCADDKQSFKTLNHGRTKEIVFFKSKLLFLDLF